MSCTGISSGHTLNKKTSVHDLGTFNLVNTSHAVSYEERENECGRVTINFSVISDWLRR